MAVMQKWLKGNITNLLVILLLLIAFLILKMPNNSYEYLNTELALIPLSLVCVILNLILNIAIAIFLCIRKKFKIELNGLLLSLFITLFWFHSFYPWARTQIRIRPVEDVCWREQALSDTSEMLKCYIKQHDGIVPANDGWIENFIAEGYDSQCLIKIWQSHYKSTIILNENIKGQKLSNVKSDCVFLFEGPIGMEFGNSDIFSDYAENNDYCYLVLIDGASGRFTYENKEFESIFSRSPAKLDLLWK